METKTNVENKELVLDDLLVVSSSPHLRSESTTQRIMLDVVIALVPALIAAVYFFGIQALAVALVGVVAAVASEYICEVLTKRTLTINDMSAVLRDCSSLLTFLSLCPWQVAIGNIFAIIIVVTVRRIGSNFMNPALAAQHSCWRLTTR